MANIQVAVINTSTVLTDDQVQAAVPALQIQVHRDFAPVWGIDADLTAGIKSLPCDITLSLAYAAYGHRQAAAGIGVPCPAISGGGARLN
jgi:hypothetical protein